MLNRRSVVQGLGGVAGALLCRNSLLAAGIPTGESATPPSPFTLPPLPYAYDALEPWFDAETMHLHHDKHHQAYVNTLNALVSAHPELAGKSLHQLLTSPDTLPEAVRTGVRNQAGGHANHSFWWSTLGHSSRPTPTGELSKVINARFGSISAFQEKFIAAATGIFGSGWLWLVQLGDGSLSLESTANQDSPLSLGHTPIFAVDVWEHAYYLKYQNRRAEYVKAFFQVLNWDVVSAAYASAHKG